jgi:hypothetical protein
MKCKQCCNSAAGISLNYDLANGASDVMVVCFLLADGTDEQELSI